MLDPDIILPFHPSGFLRNAQSQEESIRDLVLALTEMYRNIADAFNGYILYSNSAENSTSWVPYLSGESSEGTGTYSVQTGWSVRQGYMVDVFFDIEWSGHTGTGNLLVNLPFRVIASQTPTTTNPFPGSVITSNITLPGSRTYAALQAVSGTYTARLIACGSALASQEITLPTSGRIIGNLRYMGKIDEG